MAARMPFLSSAENRFSFFSRIAHFLPALDPRYKQIERAYNQAKDAFRGKRRDDGGRYFEHLRAVALIIIDYLMVRDCELIIAALLHDIVEDVPTWTIQRVKEEFGDEVALLVEWLTKPPRNEFESKQDRDDAYYARFRFAPRKFWLIKLPDRYHNLATLWACDAKKKARKILETRIHYLPYAEKELILYHELLEALADLEKGEIRPQKADVCVLDV